MKIIFACRANIFIVPGGDTVQLLRLKEHLAPRGVEAAIAPEPDAIRPGAADIVHVFNIFDTDSACAHAAAARAAQIPLVITPNYWDPMEFFFQTSPSLFHRLVRRLLPEATAFRWYAANKRRKLLPERVRQREVLAAAARILPNSAAEAGHLARDFALNDSSRFSVVYNAVDYEAAAAASAEWFAGRYGIKDFVLAVGRFEERKNQLGIVRELAAFPAPLVFIGGVPPYQRPYFEACRRAAAGRRDILFIEGLSQREVFSAMHAARVHVLASWWENTGLVSLEAAACGCRIVTTDRSPHQEYFGDSAHLCDPARPGSIAAAVARAWQAPPPAGLAAEIKTKFTWPNAAAALEKIYAEVLEAGASRK